jgi:hypothetical protein
MSIPTVDHLGFLIELGKYVAWVRRGGRASISLDLNARDIDELRHGAKLMFMPVYFFPNEVELSKGVLIREIDKTPGT